MSECSSALPPTTNHAVRDAIFIQENDVRQLTNEIWNGMLQMDLVTSPVVERVRPGIGACVQITGAWEGAVRVECSLELARLATARFLATEPGQVHIDQIRDAMGELANMSAGSVKPLLPSPCQLSLPSVADGTDYTLSIPQGQPILTAGFAFRGEPLTVAVLQRKAH
jgi:chemotaxis protein CheX